MGIMRRGPSCGLKQALTKGKKKDPVGWPGFRFRAGVCTAAHYFLSLGQSSAHRRLSNALPGAFVTFRDAGSYATADLLPRRLRPTVR